MLFLVGTAAVRTQAVGFLLFSFGTEALGTSIVEVRLFSVGTGTAATGAVEFILFSVIIVEMRVNQFLLFSVVGVPVCVPRRMFEQGAWRRNLVVQGSRLGSCSLPVISGSALGKLNYWRSTLILNLLPIGRQMSTGLLLQYWEGGNKWG